MAELRSEVSAMMPRAHFRDDVSLYTNYILGGTWVSVASGSCVYGFWLDEVVFGV
jgi:hypothetical protein